MSSKTGFFGGPQGDLFGFGPRGLGAVSQLGREADGMDGRTGDQRAGAQGRVDDRCCLGVVGRHVGESTRLLGIPVGDLGRIVASEGIEQGGHA
jgi:hypothetical protein